jgi:hypothetical protein
MIFVLGNGLSRKAVEISWLKRRGLVYACNAAYRLDTPDVLVATDQPIATEIQSCGYSLKNTFYTRRPVNGTGALQLPKKIFGHSSGPAAVALASDQPEETQIYLIGFDLGGTVDGKFNNLYAGTKFYRPPEAPVTFAGNWVRQIAAVCKEHPEKNYIRIIGETTNNDCPELDELQNVGQQSFDSFFVELNSRKDL